MQFSLFEEDNWLDVKDGKVLHVPSFLQKAQADTLFNQLIHEFPWQQIPIQMYGKEVLQPRLQAWFGKPYSYTGLQLNAAPMPSVLDGIKAQCEQKSGESFNSVFANYYRNGQDYMGWHQDNEPELGENPVIASVSLGETRRFLLRHIRSKEKIEFLLSHGSLLVMGKGIQTYWQHAVPKTAKTKKARINLTFRQIM